MRRTLPRRSISALGALTAAFTLAGAVSAVPASAAAGPNLKVTATAQQGRWLPGDEIPIDLTVTNIGDALAEQVKGYGSRESGPYFLFAQNTWGDLEKQGPGASFAPGASRTYHLRGSVGTLTEGNPVVRIDVVGAPEADESDNIAMVPVELVPADTTERVAGHLYADKNRDGLPSTGENVVGAEARIGGPGMPQDLVANTDAHGRFVFDAVPAGTQRWLSFQDLPEGWLVPNRPPLRIDGSGQNTALDVPIKRPLSEALQATSSLNKASYATGETATATFTLTNVGDVPLTGLYAACDPVGIDHDVVVPLEQWGAFSPLKQTGELAPGQRLVITVSGKVPAVASSFGLTDLTCGFNGETYVDGPYTSAKAKVPGKSGDTRGRVWTDKNGNGQLDAGEGLAAKTKIALTTDGTNVVAFAQTDANGFATFTDVPVGDYILRTVGPTWKTVDNPTVYHYAPPYRFDWQIQVAPR